MDTSTLGSSTLAVSRVALGCMSLTQDTASYQVLEQALELGITMFDTADLYDQGRNEILIGKALKPVRDKVILASKVGNVWREDGSGWDWRPSGGYIRGAIFRTLERLQTDYLDLYQLHGGTLDDPIDEIIDAFEALQREGWIRYYGISSIRPNVIREYVKRANIVSVMMQYSLFDRRPEEQCLDFLAEHNISVIVRGALAKGLLATKAPQAYLEYNTDEVAHYQHVLRELAEEHNLPPAYLTMHYTLAHPAVATLAVGASTPEQLAHNAALFKSPSPPDAVLQALRNTFPSMRYQVHR